MKNRFSLSFSREKDKNYFDFTLLLVVLALVLLGMVMIYSASSFKAQALYGDSHLFLKKQMIRVLIGLGLMCLVMQIDYQLIRKAAPFFLLLSFMALIFVLVSPSESLLKGSRRWIEIKGFIFQPSELAKYALVLFLAFFLSKKENVLDSFLDGLLPALL
ncbi:MAG: FtsW/RodA/SpoVE family cell cycle protein, partial [candidate division KSB1 bacterium]|nr:FtsW/RodA/SpoVE family cell cycle protein [candidate division KSB1 bacterium]